MTPRLYGLLLVVVAAAGIAAVVALPESGVQKREGWYR